MRLLLIREGIKSGEEREKKKANQMHNNNNNCPKKEPIYRVSG
jgi:hypothetical protein